jgi:aryl-alcohol dehydrogenase-like predicted oxidoreductase
MSGVSNEHREPPLQEIPWREESISRIILGTAQLGMDYGIANRVGQPDQRTATAIIESAWRHGIRHFDTAQAYGASERVLGQALRDLGVSDQAHVASKLSAQLDPAQVSELEASLNGRSSFWEPIGCGA